MAEHSPQGDSYEPSLFELARVGQFDPVLASILEEVAEAQEQIDGLTEFTRQNVSRILESLNELWESTGWVGTVVEYSGRLRYFIEEFTDLPNYQFLTSSWRADQNEGVTVFQVVEEQLLCGYFDVAHTHDSIEDDEECGHDAASCPAKQIRLTVAHPAHYSDDNEWEPDFALYPQDIEQLSFSQASADAIGEELKYHFPAIYKKIGEHLSPPPLKDKHITAILKEFAIDARPNDYHGYDLPGKLGEYLYKMIGFDDEYYEVRVQGPVYSMDEADGPCKSETTSQQHSYEGAVVGIHMEFESEAESLTLRPTIVMAVPQPEHLGNFFLLKIPAESLVRIRSTRTRRTGFGQRALYDFKSAREVRQFFLSMGSFGASSVEDPTSATYGNAEFQTAPRGDDEMDDLRTVHELLDSTLIPLAADVKAVVGDFYSHVSALEETEIDTPLSDEDYHRVGCWMSKTLKQLDSFRRGSIILVRGNTLVVEDAPKEAQDVFRLENNHGLIGRLVAVTISKFPDMHFCKGGETDVPIHSIEMGIVLEHCVLLDDSGRQYRLPGAVPRHIVPLFDVPSVEYFHVERQ